MTTETEAPIGAETTLGSEAPEKDAKEQAPEQSAEPAGEAATDTEAEKQGEVIKAIKRDAGRIQKGFDRLTAQKYAAEAKSASLERQLSELKQRHSELQKQPFNGSLEEQDDNRLRKVFIEENARSTARELDAAKLELSHASAELSHELMVAKLEEAGDRIPAAEVLKKLRDLPKLSEHTIRYVVGSDKAVDLAAYLADNPSVAADLWGKDRFEQALELRDLERQLKPPPPRKTSTAPPPVPTVAGNPSPAGKSTSELSIAEMQAAFKKKGLIR